VGRGEARPLACGRERGQAPGCVGRWGARGARAGLGEVLRDREGGAL
jgi:hypothetical protein